MNNEKTPLSRIVDWFDGLDEFVKGEVAFLANYITDSQGTLGADANKTIAAFRNWLVSCSESRQEIVSHALHSRAIIEYVCRGRFTQKGWDETKRRTESLLDMARSDGAEHSDAIITAMLDDMPRRSAVWITVGDSWSALTAGAISDKALEDWQLLSSKNGTR